MYAQQYVENDLVDKTPIELVRLLYSKAIEKTKQAALHTRNGELRERGLCLARVMEIVAELNGALNLEAGGKLALDLAKLYDYIQRQLILAAGDATGESELTEVGVLLENLFEGWRDCDPPAEASGQVPTRTAAERLLVFDSTTARQSCEEQPAQRLVFANSRTDEELSAQLITSERESRVWTL